MWSRSFPAHELERPGPPLGPELARMIESAPDAVCRTLEPILTAERKARIELVLDSRLRSVVLVLDHLRDPHNRAAILRTAEALGVQEVHAIQPDGAWPLSRRVTQGCHKWLDVVVYDGVEPCAAALARRGYALVEASEKAPGGGAVTPALEPGRPVALCLGNEHAGVTDELRSRCEARVGIPLYGFTGSLNVSVAAALLVTSLLPLHPRGLAPDDRARLKARYYVQSVQAPLDVLRRALTLPSSLHST
jgi:tRNA (guanosine-2'-O-)-methyltransferase